MTWFAWLGFALIITAVAAVIGLQPSGARPVARTGLMGMGRFVLVVLIILCGYLAFRAYSGR